MISIKIFASDEGFGHIVRQKAIIDELVKLSDADIVFQTWRHFGAAKKFIGNKARYNQQFNNIMTVKKKDGSLDIEKTYEWFMKKYPENSRKMIERESINFEHDFVISDFVPEAFRISRNARIPNCGVGHFTWDWFFSKLYPWDKTLTNTLDKYMENMDEIYFPPLTPDENLKKFKSRAKVVPFIISKDYLGKKTKPRKKFTVLISDSGTGALYHIIKKNLPVFKRMPEFHFLVPPGFKVKAKNITVIPKTEAMPKLIPKSDLVVARAGFNTITMCIVSQVPLLLVEETGSPEVEENLRKVRELGLCGEMSPPQYSKDFKRTLMSFLEKEYDFVLGAMKNYKFKTNGAEIIAKSILKRIKK